MRDRPTGPELLACARKVLREDVLPALPAASKPTLLMVMNAMSIAERQLQFGDAPEARELDALRQLLDERVATLADGNRLLASQLRAGAADPGRAQRGALLARLRTIAGQRLAESNPKLLPGGSDAGTTR